MVTAKWNNEIIAKSDKCILLENNYYFPKDSVNNEFLSESDQHSICPWKGKASYYNISVHGKLNKNAAWYYPAPKKEARHIKNYIAFWNKIEIFVEK